MSGSMEWVKLGKKVAYAAAFAIVAALLPAATAMAGGNPVEWVTVGRMALGAGIVSGLVVIQNVLKHPPW